MKIDFRFFYPLAIVSLLGMLSACTQPTGLVNVAMSPAEDRSFDRLRADTTIALQINEVLLGEAYRDLYAEISTDVYEGIVLLTGTVKYAQNKERATNLMRGIKNVVEAVHAALVERGGAQRLALHGSGGYPLPLCPRASR